MTNDTFDLTIRKVIPAARKAVFEAWLDPKALAAFMKPAEGVTVPKVEVDAREGGQFLIVMKAGEEELPHRGEYQTIDRHDRLVFTWVSGPAGDSTVTIDFVELGPNETELVLRHRGLPSRKAREDHEGGWTAIVDRLGTVVA